MVKSVTQTLHALLFLILIGTGGSIAYFLRTAPANTRASIPAATWTSVPISTAVPNVPAPTETVPQTKPETGWTTLQPGLERRVNEVYDAQGQVVESIYVWRLDQKYFRLDVAFEANPKTLQSWQQETSAAMVVNGGYFSINSEQYTPDGLIVQNGEASGRSFNGYGGMLAVDRSRAEVRWLVEKPYNAGEPLQAALQAFPILVEPGGRLGFPAARENYARARRTVIAQDRAGRILFIVTPQGYFTLHGLSSYLTASDLNLDIALNLDGGGSTGIMVANPREIIASRVLLPFVILVYPR